MANMSSGNQYVISSLQRLLNLLISGNSQSIDTATEVEFLLKPTFRNKLMNKIPNMVYLDNQV